MTSTKTLHPQSDYTDIRLVSLHVSGYHQNRELRDVDDRYLHGAERRGLREIKTTWFKPLWNDYPAS